VIAAVVLLLGTATILFWPMYDLLPPPHRPIGAVGGTGVVRQYATTRDRSFVAPPTVTPGREAFLRRWLRCAYPDSTGAISWELYRERRLSGSSAFHRDDLGDTCYNMADDKPLRTPPLTGGRELTSSTGDAALLPGGAGGGRMGMGGGDERLGANYPTSLPHLGGARGASPSGRLRAALLAFGRSCSILKAIDPAAALWLRPIRRGRSPTSSAGPASAEVGDSGVVQLTANGSDRVSLRSGSG
jgi:hypothetical protein